MPRLDLLTVIAIAEHQPQAAFDYPRNAGMRYCAACMMALLERSHVNPVYHLNLAYLTEAIGNGDLACVRCNATLEVCRHGP